ncbi:MAG: 2-dehydro-3-deoxygalactonokinase, partial [Rhodobacteraceae bacterium]|nr:2-dehydro-3-deoxygalactonokinase [Paracoccaceae bacterium]
MSGAVPAVAAVDWGTTRLRIWLLAGDATVLAERRSDEGMASAATEGFGAILERHLAAMAAPADLPAIVCGMAGARQGWIEAPYVACPAHMDDILSGAVAVPGAARPVRIVPGVAQHGDGPPDVMRGEETQLAGIAPRIAHGVHSVCIPGTHSKWIHAASGAVERFATFLTGELYALLSTASILRHSVGDGAASASNPA